MGNVEGTGNIGVIGVLHRIVSLMLTINVRIGLKDT